MKIKLIVIPLLLLLCLCLVSPVDATEADRQISEYITDPNKDVIKSTAGEVFGVTAIATSGGGWIALYDVSSASSITVSLEPKIEIMEATANNTGVKDWPEGFNFYNGIYVDGSNVKSIIYYR